MTAYFSTISYGLVSSLLRLHGRPFCLRQVMLWLMAALLALAEDVLSEEDGPENQLKPHRHVLGRPPWRPSASEESRDHVASLWPEALGSHFFERLCER